MDNFRFLHTMEVRYGDLDPQWHLNNARYLSFFEQGRFAYLLRLGLWDGEDFQDLKSIIADIHITFLKPVTLKQKVVIGVKVSHIGNKSLTFFQQMADAESGEVLSQSETIIVTFDYRSQSSIPVPQDWKDKIQAFENDNDPG